MESLIGFYKDKVVLVTGAHGFKGSWLCILLRFLGAKVIAYGLVNSASVRLHLNVKSMFPEIEFIDGDIRDSERMTRTLAQFQPSIIFHLAAEPLVSTGFDIPKTVFDVNVMGTVSLLEAIRSTDSVNAVVNVTTDKVYANSEERKAFKEEFKLGGDDPYSASKAASEIITKSYYQSFFKDKVGVATARAGNVIGPGDFSDNRLIPDVIRACDSNKVLEIRNPSSVRPWQHVADPIIGYTLLAKRLCEAPTLFSDAFNFGPEHSQILSVEDLINLLKNHSLIDCKIGFVDNHISEKKYLALDSEKSVSLLNWNNKANMLSEMESIVAGYKLIDQKDLFIEHCKQTLIRKFEESYYDTK